MNHEDILRVSERLIVFVRDNPEMNIRQISRNIDVCSSHVHRLVNILEENYILFDDTEKNCHTRVMLTEKGKYIAQNIEKIKSVM